MNCALAVLALNLVPWAGEVNADPEDFNLFLFMYLVMGILCAGALFAAGALIVACVAAAGGTFVLSSAALSSLLTAMLRRSPSVGLTLFVAQMGAAAGFSLVQASRFCIPSMLALLY